MSSDDPLTHFSPAGAAHMVGIEGKPETPRRAVAAARVRMAPATLRRITEGGVGKGDVLGVARIAAIAASKRCAELIPLCHPVRLTAVDVTFEVVESLPGVEVRAEVRAIDRTGPEMEAMTAASVAALTIYDMCKAMDRGMAVEAVVLLEKDGGKSGHWRREG
ncbi:cyclic pyranopterin monophosphate synthase MoaC [Paraliomyxa miuraensis]|uniref:cyclic pyranopterin monophosphate synthase MoaC n=1 Tax=Paraliomyxa miuraensis TaxID=376150 RepID=UPI00224FE4C3|nr:cyclic pyranopterin monophosphate synthase MoaC [Paraliomyxa miuraensis]MCX4247643.1 cyclic pyranopterin monophosphate synthase MoaC [Paraliomyxa miuraensis]